MSSRRLIRALYSIGRKFVLKHVDHRIKSGGRLCNGVRP